MCLLNHKMSQLLRHFTHKLFRFLVALLHLIALNVSHYSVEEVLSNFILLLEDLQCLNFLIDKLRVLIIRLYNRNHDTN